MQGIQQDHLLTAVKFGSTQILISEIYNFTALKNILELHVTLAYVNR